MAISLPFVACSMLLVVAAGCGEPCPPIEQTVHVNAPDAALLRLVADCTSKGTSTACAPDELTCVCRPLCLRLLELVDGFVGNEELQSCYVQTRNSVSSTAEDRLRFTDDAIMASLKYRPSRCDEQAR